MIASATMTLTLTITDAECFSELMAREEGPERDFLALSALRVGVLSLRQAAGVIDRQGLRNEGDRLIDSLRGALTTHYEKTTNDIGSVLEKYFDVNDGAFLQRLDRLVKKDGELESILSRHVGNESALSATLERHLGSESPILQTVSTDRSKGLLAALNEVLSDSVESHNKAITGEFTLDNKDSALARLVASITDENGKLRKEFSADVETMRKEFSLDNEDGALCRLVRQVEQSRRAMVAEFAPDNENSILSKIGRLLETTNESILGSLTLDDEDSPLSRLKRELVGAVDEMQKKNTDFQTEVRETLAAITAKRTEAKRSTRHGDEFHEEVAPAGLDVISRFGQDIVVVWDADDTLSDVNLKAAYSIARCIAVEQTKDDAAKTGERVAIETAIKAINRSLETLNSIQTMANTVKNNGEKIAKQASKLMVDVSTQLDLIDQHVAGLA